MLSPEELETLLSTLDDLEAQVASLTAENDFLHRERVLYKEGPRELLAQFGRASEAEPVHVPKGYAISPNTGELYLADHEMIYAMLREMRRG